jgi:hypothetical protein
MEAPVCANAFEPSDKTPANNRMPIFFIHASICIGEGCKYEHGGGSLSAQQSEDGALRASAVCVKLQVGCLGVGVEIELDHSPINAPSRPLWVISGHMRRKTSCLLYTQ